MYGWAVLATIVYTWFGRTRSRDSARGNRRSSASCLPTTNLSHAATFVVLGVEGAVMERARRRQQRRERQARTVYLSCLLAEWGPRSAALFLFVCAS